MGYGMDELIASNDLLEHPARLRHRAEEQGCLFFRGLVDPDRVREVRRDILALCAAAGWLQPGTHAEEGVAAPGVAHVEPEPAYMAVYNEVMKLESFHSVAHFPTIIAMLDDMFDEACFPHPRNIARIVFPQNEKFTTPAHQDFVHIQGTEDVWTAWIPLGDCPRALGGVEVLPGSHRFGVTHDGAAAPGEAFDQRLRPGAVDESRAVIAAVPAGGAVFFHDLTLHSSFPNTAGQDRWAWIGTYRDAQAEDEQYSWAVAAAVVRGHGRQDSR